MSTWVTLQVMKTHRRSFFDICLHIISRCIAIALCMAALFGRYMAFNNVFDGTYKGIWLELAG